MAKTRSMTRARKAAYRKSLKSSRCRKLGRATCRRTSGCKRANGTKRSFCRKSKNTHH